MADNGIYQYSPLAQEDGIRLIIIQPSSDLNAMVRCSLIQTSLFECEHDIVNHYTALSYVWGDATLQRTILVNGKKLYVTASLEEALRHIRDHNSPLCVWADGVCIDQEDVKDRIQQVRHMGRIYELAAHTIIFLGPKTTETNSLLQVLARLPTPEARTIGKSFLQEKLGISEAELVDMTKDLLGKPWWARVWVLQELVLSSDPWVQYASSRIRFDIFSNFLLPVVTETPLSEQMDEHLWLLLSMDDGRSGFKVRRLSREQESPGDFLQKLISSRR